MDDRTAGRHPKLINDDSASRNEVHQLAFIPVPNSNAVQDPVDGARASLWQNKEQEQWVSLDWNTVRDFRLYIVREPAPDYLVVDGIRPRLLLDARMIAGWLGLSRMHDRERNNAIIRKAIDGMVSLHKYIEKISPKPVFYTNFAEIVAERRPPLTFDMPSNDELFYLIR